MYGEDIDLSFKILKAGYKNHYAGTIDVLHYKGESTQKDSKYYDRFYGAMRIFYKKHFKTNSILNMFVAMGVAMAKILRKSGSKNEIQPATMHEEAYVFTEDLRMYRSLSEQLDIQLKTASKSMFDDGALRNCLFIFDVNYMPYSQIFLVMKKLRNRNNQFRICPPNCNFIVGSDMSDEKGSVIVF
jgi:hypothetical protein